MFHFVANLKPYVFHPGQGRRRFDAFLLSVDHIDDAKTLPVRVRKAKRLLVADNGNFDRVRGLAARFSERAAGVLRSSTTRSKGMAELIADLRAADRDERTVIGGKAIETQLGLAPSYLIGMEDLVFPSLGMLQIGREHMGDAETLVRQAAEVAVTHAEETCAGRYGACSAEVFAGMHAFDFDSAHEAGRIAGEAGLTSLAVGFSGAMQDKRYIASRLQHGVVHALESSVPSPYVRAVELAAGFHLGFARATGHRPRFHALGLGTPILLPLLATLGSADTYTAADSTSPIRDAWMEATTSLYVAKPAPMKLKAQRIAEHWLDGIPWSCACPYCRACEREHPADLRAARAWWTAEGKRPIEAVDLRASSPLSRFLPLLSNPADPVVRNATAMARIGHNHWVLRQIEQAARRTSKDPRALHAWAEGIVEDYLESHADEAWKRAIRASWGIISEAVRNLDGAGPGGPVGGKTNGKRGVP